MILSHDPSKTWGESLLCSLALAKRRHKQGYDAVKLAAACGIPGPETGLPGGVANTASYPPGPEKGLPGGVANTASY